MHRCLVSQNTPSIHGGAFFLRIHENCDLQKVAQEFSGTVLATSIQATKTLFEISLAGPIAFVFGNEGAGLSKEMIQAANENISIPMPGKTESLNAAAAAAICFLKRCARIERLQNFPALELNNAAVYYTAPNNTVFLELA